MRVHLKKDFPAGAGGSVSVLFAFVTFVFFGFIGVAVDYSRWHDLRSRTNDALDSALLAGARALQTGQNEAAAVDTATETFLSAAKGQLNIIAPQINVTLINNGTALEGVAWGKMRTPFLGFFKTKSLKVAASSRIGFSIGGGSATGGSDLEISMMLDVTGSMCADGSGPCGASPKMDALKSAASDLVNIILKSTAPGSQSARIALVPFATRVLVGTKGDPAAEALMKKLTDLDARWSGWGKDWSGSACTWTPGATSELPGTYSCSSTSWAPVQLTDRVLSPCVTERTGAEEFTDAAPGAGSWINSMDSTRRPLYWDSASTPLTSNIGASSSDTSDLWNYTADGTCNDVDEKNIIMPLTSDKDALLARIADLRGYGATAGALGTAWAWYTISPAWSGIWPSGSVPGSYADTVASGSSPPKLRKIAVLMTDGAYNAYRAAMGQDPDTVSNNAKQICTNMKTAGIEIYTVGFDLDALPAADKARATDVLQSCGTDLSHFYDALNAEQLKNSFRDIALQLSQLYVAK